MKGKSLREGTETLLPAQLVYLSYQTIQDEHRLYLPITTGAAGGSTLAAALCRGICEIIERDAFMIYYLNRLGAPKVDLELIEDQTIQRLVTLFARYRLELSVFDITTDLRVPTFMAVAVDRTGIGPVVSVGLKAHIHPYEAIQGAIFESQHSRGWIRRVATEQPERARSMTPETIRTTEDRGLFWFPLKRLRDLSFLLRQPATPLRIEGLASPQSPGEQLHFLLDRLFENDMDVYFADVTLAQFRDLGYTVVKVIIPQAVPLYLNEKYRSLGSARLYEVPVRLGLRSRRRSEAAMNQVPHPFL